MKIISWALTVGIILCLILAPEFQNSPQLLALQKVLHSDFLKAVREVYEHVYETVDITGSPEVRANATAKVTSLNPVGVRILLNNVEKYVYVAE